VQQQATSRNAPLSARQQQANRRPLLSSRLLPYLLLAPALIAIALVIIYPIFYSLYLSLTDANLLRLSEAEFVGVDNYVRLLTREDFWQSLGVTALYTAGTVFFGYFMGLLTALILNQNFRFRGLARTLISIPWATPWLVVTLIWYVMFNPQMGPINVILQRVGVIDVGIPWLYQRDTALISIVIVTVWREFPAATLLILAGLQSIQPELYEAAEVDGASRWQRFRFITMPSLRTINLVVVTLMTIWASKLFTVAWALTQGGPGDATRVLSVYTYQEAFLSNRLGRASALAILTFVLVFALVVVYFALLNREEQEA